MPELTKDKYSHNAKISTKNCLNCGITFFAHNKTAKYCSNLCRTHAYLKRKQELMKDFVKKDDFRNENKINQSTGNTILDGIFRY